jgi:hypothetical protein
MMASMNFAKLNECNFIIYLNDKLGENLYSFEKRRRQISRQNGITLLTSKTFEVVALVL